ncbi:hypothetical protein TIFTF001_031249 [Ficus carica]|uniref:Reverse transcriptase zinc-binding domain-containing protein n=1 Tax=Ficus carica TaxID=3494 RepID=A0AA88J0Q8_FICCA|nr:hypothetical protein TIFTF001_031249 [Ficus carica]
MKVSALITPASWNRNLICSAFWSVDWDVIWSFPPSVRRREDKLVWHYHIRGYYLVKLGYHIKMDCRRESECSERRPNSKWWNSLWNTWGPNKVKMHVWRACHDALPARSHLEHRVISISPLCPRCGVDTTHALWSCPGVQMVWEESTL